MSWSIGFDTKHDRDIGYGVPAACDHPDCNEQINRGLSYVCGSEPYGGEHGCGLHFCSNHRNLVEIDDQCVELCERCTHNQPEFTPKPDTQEWRDWKRTDKSWARWRAENPEKAAAL